MKNQLQDLKRKGAEIQAALDQSFEDAEQTAKEIEATSTSIDSHEQQLQDFIHERETLDKLTGNIPGIAQVDVSKTLMAGIKIMGCTLNLSSKKTRRGSRSESSSHLPLTKTRPNPLTTDYFTLGRPS